jgi:hypothetical protein
LPASLDGKHNFVTNFLPPSDRSSPSPGVA